MVCETEQPNFLDASCCNVEVVKGAEGDFFAGFFSISEILKSAEIHLFKNSSATSFLSNLLGISALKILSCSFLKIANTLNDDTDLNDSIITTIQKRGYVVKESREGIQREYQYISLTDGNVSSKIKLENTGAEKNKMFPTDIGVVVNEFLVEHFKNILDYGFTAGVEKEFDEVAEGKKKWNEMIQNFYGDFHLKVENVIGTAQKAVGERNLGVDPTSGKNVYVRIGPFGPMAQLGEKQEDDNAEKPKFASLLKSQSIQSITIEEALDLFKLPRLIGNFEGEEIVASVGRFGPYLRYKGKFTSIKKGDGDDPLTIELDRAIELIKLKIQADKERIILNFEGDPLIQVLNGRYGPFVQVSPKKAKKINIKIPKDLIPQELTREKCLDLMQNQTKSKRYKK